MEEPNGWCYTLQEKIRDQWPKEDFYVSIVPMLVDED